MDRLIVPAPRQIPGAQRLCYRLIVAETLSALARLRNPQPGISKYETDRTAATDWQS
jgi:hypothetical protein